MVSEMKTINPTLTDFQMLTLSNVSGIGRKTLLSVTEHIRFSPTTTEQLHETLLDLQKKITKFKVPSLVKLSEAESRAKRIVSQAEKDSIKIISWYNTLFPDSLKNIPDPPVLIYVRGNLKPVSEKVCVAVIGTRKPSEYGQKWAERLGAYLARNGFGVISGLALGCDAAGHEGCLKEKGYTLAVLANGLDKLYPASNRPLGERILASGGCIISEYAPGVTPRKNFFVDRDRLQSGLSKGIIVVETDIKGGTMHTVGYALKQERNVACLKHPEKYGNHSKAFGNASLISENKAVPITSEEDLLSFLRSISMEHEQKFLEMDATGHFSETGPKEQKKDIQPEQMSLF